MPDICKCPGDNCKKKEQCFRFTAHADTYQTYFHAAHCIEEDFHYFIQDKRLLSQEDNKK
jgi:hypothetical protein